MNAMRLMLPMDKPVKDCQGCCLPDEMKASAQILSFQLADKLLRHYSGSWEITQDDLQISLAGVEFPLRFELNSGILVYGSLKASILMHYHVDKGLAGLKEEIISDFDLPLTEDKEYEDPIFRLFVKLIEIFHARCGLRIRAVENADEKTVWEIYLSENGPHGWISSDGIVKNAQGEQVDIKVWFSLRPEKIAGYVFGFNSFCKNYKSPIKILR